MCGRLNITDDPLAQWISDAMGFEFHPSTNHDVRPTQSVSVISSTPTHLYQRQLQWGTKPQWSKQLIINARSESITSKLTFRDALTHNRIIVPCSGWYEWVTTDSGKQKFEFNPIEPSKGFLMAALAMGNDQFVTLTTEPNDEYALYHHRMPLLFNEKQALQWIRAPHEALKLLRWNSKIPFVATAQPIEPMQNLSLF
ncbi:DUF159 family protein [Vibrio inusitatus NBRC 102082]|uniref:Abasic site processing protein n=1 Tax=Vibrio inusitatus NBRC 102082 TaxID=1219070 RepID=A0A4Y3HUA7_9VIBR|nr:SOS response-associated peptidase family protein [Vibrio inusitatus]GEA50342.1 DUF159 family protein [Vibrio inusitatus NBRC 102082]